MSFEMLAVMSLRSAHHVPGGVVAVGGATASGAEVAGTIGGLVGAAVGVIGLFLTIAGMNSKRRREYQQEIRDAEERGEQRKADLLMPQIRDLRSDVESLKADRDFYRNLAWNTHGTGPLPTPPSEQPPSGGST